MPQENLRNKYITSPNPWLLYLCFWIAKFSLKLCHWKSNGNDCKVGSKSYRCLAGKRTFPGSHLSKNYGNGNTADNSFSPNTADFKMQTSHTVKLEITATPHKKMHNTANPQCPPPYGMLNVSFFPYTSKRVATLLRQHRLGWSASIINSVCFPVKCLSDIAYRCKKQ